MAAKERSTSREPTIENRRARHDYAIEDTLECGIELLGTEVKSLRNSQVQLDQGFVMAKATPASLELHGVHISEYPQALPQHQHAPTRVRRLLAHKREIEKLATQQKAKGASLVPLKIYFVKGRAKLLVGVGFGRKKGDKREHIKEKEAKRDMQRATGARRRL
jgi:SsrA-binding protein